MFEQVLPDHVAADGEVPDLVDAIVDVTETGSSLRANKLRIVETLMTSSPQFVANKKAFTDPWKRAPTVLLIHGFAERCRRL